MTINPPTMEPVNNSISPYSSRFFVFHPLVLLLSPHDKYATSYDEKVHSV